MRRCLPIAVVLVSLLCSCGSTRHLRTRHSAPHSGTVIADSSGRVPAKPALASPQALVTDERQSRVLVVDLPGGRIASRVRVPSDPQDIAASASGGVVVVVSSEAGEVTVLDRSSLRPVRMFGGFEQPHIVAISPEHSFAYVTDDLQGTVTAIRLRDPRETSTTVVGVGAHHLAFSPDQRRVWVALGESASRISILDTSDLGRPGLIGQFDPGFAAHDVSFSPNGRQVWVTSAAGPDVSVFKPGTRRVMFGVHVGPPPQHVAFAGRYAYLTSGYGGRLEKVDSLDGRVVAAARSPYGSFELSVADGYVAATSLLRGTLAIYTPDLKLMRVVKLAPATREVAISRP